jgi:hypothetical protein
MPFSVVVWYQFFRGTCFLHLYDRRCIVARWVSTYLSIYTYIKLVFCQYFITINKCNLIL